MSSQHPAGQHGHYSRQQVYKAMTRKKDFERIRNVITSYIKTTVSKALVAEGDSLALLRLFPDECVSLVLTDPPYHSTKKQNIYGDTAFRKDKEYIDWMNEYAKEWRRVLRPNGSMFCFCSPLLAGKLEVMFSQYFNVLSHIVWTKPNEPGFDGWKQKMKKEALRQWYAHTERIIYAEPAFDGNPRRSYFAEFLRGARRKAGLTMHQLTELTGFYGRINHGGAVSNWEAGRNIPSQEQYKRICDAIIKRGDIKSMPPYEDVIRRFSVDASKEFTDVWNFPSVRPYRGKHPAEKPLCLLHHAIETTTYVGDIVLDCFAGSGNTALAAMKLNRYSVMIDIDAKWVNSAGRKLQMFSGKGRFIHECSSNGEKSAKQNHQVTLFSN